MKPGDKVIVFYDGFVLYVPKDTQVDETLLRRAITERPKALWNDEKAGKPLPNISETGNA